MLPHSFSLLFCHVYFLALPPRSFLRLTFTLIPSSHCHVYFLALPPRSFPRLTAALFSSPYRHAHSFAFAAAFSLFSAALNFTILLINSSGSG
ncbi:hypothetical protein [Paenibacillus sp. S150]|uniref:hypothetical protein n=1 Tax=Paenibacillus sp. S150 TaxID=2749826 RepID=UPI001C569720|nr:hypothetical protein [Paenibacillus sp. S150]MBW4082271.1 hypothetical protein [Paenibacillus sp. S150]